MTDVEKAVFAAVYARAWCQPGDGELAAERGRQAVDDLRALPIFDEIRGITRASPAVCRHCGKVVTTPFYYWDHVYCSRACLNRGTM